MIANNWNPYPKVKPKDRQRCLVTLKSSYGFPEYIDILMYSDDLYSVDRFDFENEKGKNGFYGYSCSDDCGYIYYDDVIAWMPLPEPYVEK